MVWSDLHSSESSEFEEHRFIQYTCNTILFPFIELLRRTIPFNKGVLTAIRPVYAPVPEFEVPPFSPFQVAVRFADTGAGGDLSSPEIMSLVHSMGGFSLNLLFVAHKHAQFYRYGLVLETEGKMDEATVKTAYQQALKKNRLDRLIVEREPSLVPFEDEQEMGLIFEAYRTLAQKNYVKLYFRNQF